MIIKSTKKRSLWTGFKNIRNFKKSYRKQVIYLF